MIQAVTQSNNTDIYDPQQESERNQGIHGVDQPTNN